MRIMGRAGRKLLCFFHNVHRQRGNGGNPLGKVAQHVAVLDVIVVYATPNTIVALARISLDDAPTRISYSPGSATHCPWYGS